MEEEREWEISGAISCEFVDVRTEFGVVSKLD